MPAHQLKQIPPHVDSAPSRGRQAQARPVFLPLNGRRLFALQIVPTGPCLGSVLYLPPFAEEMNRCRSTVAAMARALAGRGWHVLLLDHYGTGESDGEVTDGDWALWCADAAAAAQWLAAHTGHAPMLWGLRTGALMAAELLAQHGVGGQQLLLWQPVLEGKLFINQYLRLRIASQMVRDGERETTETIRSELARGGAVEIAGYPLTGRLADAVCDRRLADFTSTLASHQIHWIEVVSKTDQCLALPSRKLIDSLLDVGTVVHHATVVCPMVWQLQERSDTQALLQSSLDLLTQAGPALTAQRAGVSA